MIRTTNHFSPAFLNCGELIQLRRGDPMRPLDLPSLQRYWISHFCPVFLARLTPNVRVDACRVYILLQSWLPRKKSPYLDVAENEPGPVPWSFPHWQGGSKFAHIVAKALCPSSSSRSCYHAMANRLRSSRCTQISTSGLAAAVMHQAAGDGRVWEVETSKD